MPCDHCGQNVLNVNYSLPKPLIRRGVTRATACGMDFFSGLKQAYDSLGTEISKTFDSSAQENEGEQREKTAPTPEVNNGDSN